MLTEFQCFKLWSDQNSGQKKTIILVVEFHSHGLKSKYYYSTSTPTDTHHDQYLTVVAVAPASYQ